MQQMDAYYCGDHPLPFLTKAHEAKMHGRVPAAARRLAVELHGPRRRRRRGAPPRRGFRLSARPTDRDKRSWEIWQANQMDAESQTAFVEALVKGVSYLSVWEGQDEYPDDRRRGSDADDRRLRPRQRTTGSAPPR
jgi:hypothetical protein